MNEYVDRNPTPHIDWLTERGTKAEYLIPVFPTKTFPNHYSIVTGLYPENHGIITNSFYDDKLESRFSYGPQGTPNDERWWGGEPIWTTVENQGKKAATMFWPGSEAEINGVRPTKWMNYDGSVPNRTRIDSVLTWLDPKGETDADFATLYFSDVDSRGHSFGPDSPEVDFAVQQMDSLIGYLLDGLQKTGLKDHIHMMITSDHGMVKLSEEKVIFLEDLIDLNDIEVVDWTPVAMLNPKQGKKELVYRQLKEKEEKYRVFLKENLPEKYYFKKHHRIPDIIMIADMPWSISNRPFFENRGLLTATHGYDHEASEMRTYFLAYGPKIKKGYVTEPFQLIHLYEFMAHILNIEPSDNDGSLDKMIKILE